MSRCDAKGAQIALNERTHDQKQRPLAFQKQDFLTIILLGIFARNIVFKFIMRVELI